MTDRHKLMFGGAAGLVLVGLAVAGVGYLAWDKVQDRRAAEALAEYRKLAGENELDMPMILFSEQQASRTDVAGDERQKSRDAADVLRSNVARRERQMGELSVRWASRWPAH